MRINITPASSYNIIHLLYYNSNVRREYLALLPSPATPLQLRIRAAVLSHMVQSVECNDNAATSYGPMTYMYNIVLHKRKLGDKASVFPHF